MRYICSICGFVYDEAAGIPEAGIAPGTKWADLPDAWTCPLCGAAKAAFRPEGGAQKPAAPPAPAPAHELREMSALEVSALCSNLARGCEKQYLARESALFRQLSDYYRDRAAPAEESDFSALAARIEEDLQSGFPAARAAGEALKDRGALRAVTWAEKVTNILASLLARYEREPEAVKHTNVFVCEICGFIYLGLNPPEICPVCKVPNLKIVQMARR